MRKFMVSDFQNPQVIEVVIVGEDDSGKVICLVVEGGFPTNEEILVLEENLYFTRDVAAGVVNSFKNTHRNTHRPWLR